ncbi:lysophospholipid acyltransferase family protein [Propioniferax innocua]|uniref:1-acyl-sn-glycerol-3-phosphate acyltransferase n=1 Tax=Propioniferax innocua TaxID=1753 RepID=A0A542ZQ79_9ACTN|nr:lysophospholipid acyltransferase family protein [Propioniferax innocua]TQL62426.1 hypothetical protein FB460_0201 [Propioniferax innocua]
MSREPATWAHGGGQRRQSMWKQALADIRRLVGHRGWKGPKNAPKPIRGLPVMPHSTAPVALRAKFHAEGTGLGEHLLGRGPLVIVANMADDADPGRVLAALPAERRRHTLVVLRRPNFQQWMRLPLAEVNVDRPRIGGGRLVRWLQRGGTVLFFPESEISTDGELGGFHPFGAELAHRAGVRIAPAAVQGSFNGDEVHVRFGAPISIEPYDTAASRSRAAVASLLAEGATSWWKALTTPETDSPQPDHATWRRIWSNSAPGADKSSRRRSIWR